MNAFATARFRAGIVFGFLAVALGLLSVRLLWIQVVRHDEFARAARVQHLDTETLPAARGDIVDRAGRILATSRLVPSLAVDPLLLPDRAEAARVLAEAFEVDRAALAARLAVPGSRFAWVRRGLDDPGARDRIAALPLPAEAIVVREEMRRCYPLGPLAAHVLGFADADGRGIEGIEKSLDARLRGTPGKRTVFVDARRRPVALPGAAALPAQPGREVRLTLDAVLQGFAEDELRRTMEENGPRAAICVLADARTGDLLALASAPTFDPARPGAAPAEARRARFATDMFEPGSTFKPLVAAAALEARAVAEDEVFDCGEGWIRIGRRTIHENEARGHGRIPLSKVIAVSSNCGMARIALKLGIDRTFDALGAFGFGRPTDIRFPGESSGRITPRKAWTETYTLASVSFGQEIAVTPLQLVGAYMPVLGDGRKVPLRLVHDDGPAPVAADGVAAAPAPHPRVLAPANAARMRKFMEGVVTGGTGKRIAGSGYRLAGKTGTAQKMKGGVAAEYVSSFLGFGPVEDPRVVCLVLCDEPSRAKGTPTGGRVAAPYAASLLRRSLRYLGVRPSEGPAKEAP